MSMTSAATLSSAAKRCKPLPLPLPPIGGPSRALLRARCISGVARANVILVLLMI
jgi:hypothetical protein